jgi:hypothetical protein
MPGHPPRGRLSQLRKRPVTAGLAVTAAVACLVALGFGLSGGLRPAPSPGTGTIRTSAFTLTRYANGTDKLTINADVISEPGTLQDDLAEFGIPAIVTTGSFCSSSPAPDGFSRVVTLHPGLRGDGRPHGNGNPTITINPAAIPAGAELSFGIFQPPSGPGPLTAIALTDAGSYTCSGTVPVTLPPGGALLHMPIGS